MTEAESKKNESIADPSVELTNTLQRVQADFENYRKRTQNELTQQYAHGKATAFKEMLAYADTLDSAITKVKDAHQKDLENLRAQFLKLLAQNGVKPIETINKPFDPFVSECILQGNDPSKKEDIVLEEFQRGYWFHDDVLRTAKVKVNKYVSMESDHDNQPTKQGETKHE